MIKLYPVLMALRAPVYIMYVYNTVPSDTRTAVVREYHICNPLMVTYDAWFIVSKDSPTETNVCCTT